jgi:ferric-dicitrate binding protein FerR (iron transport regulator)
MVNDSNNNIDQLIIDYFSGNADENSLNEIKQYCSESDSNREYVRSKFLIYFSSGSLNDNKADEEEAFNRFINRVNNKRRNYWLKRAIAISAAIIIILLMPFVGYKYAKTSFDDNLADIVINAPRGTSTEVELPDGTKVWLNAHSRLTYSKSFGVNNRRITLKGEGLFDVVHNEDLPFTVSSGKVNLKVVGTRFDFRNYTDEPTATVDLIRGKVMLESDSKEKMYLDCNERMTYNKSTGTMSKTSIDASSSGLWIHGELFFDEIPLKDIAKELSMTYNEPIEVSDKVKNITFYGNFDTENHTLDDILRTISTTKLVKYKHVGDKYILY